MGLEDDARAEAARLADMERRRREAQPPYPSELSREFVALAAKHGAERVPVGDYEQRKYAFSLIRSLDNRPTTYSRWVPTGAWVYRVEYNDSDMWHRYGVTPDGAVWRGFFDSNGFRQSDVPAGQSDVYDADRAIRDTATQLLR